MKVAVVVGLSAALVLTGFAAKSQTTNASIPSELGRGQAVFSQRCKDCHDPAVGEAPDKDALAAKTPDDIFNILKTGLMKPMAEGLSDDEMQEVAAYLTIKMTLP
jgi:mono/diheme cytochrome c family protein